MSINRPTKKTLIIIGSIGAIIVAALLVYAILVSPAKQPYRDALAQYKNVYNANSQLVARGASLNAGKATPEEFEKSIKAAQATVNSLRIENEALAKQEAMKSGEGKALYDTFNRKTVAYLAYTSDMLSSISRIRPIIFACSQSVAGATADAAGAQVMRTCAAQFESVEDVANEDYRALAAASKQRYIAFANNFEKTAMLGDPKGTGAPEATLLEQDRESIVAEMNTDAATLAKNLTAHKQAVDITDAAIALDTFLTNKSNIF